MGVLAVQIASVTSVYRRTDEDEEPKNIGAAVLHCYAVDAEFDSNTPAPLQVMRGVRAHLAGGRCLVVEVERRTRPSELIALLDELRGVLGFDDVEMRAPLNSPYAGQRVEDPEEWLGSI